MPLHAAPCEGESIDSWTDALAFRYDMSPTQMLSALGLSGYSSFIGNLIYQIEPDTLRQIEQATGLDAGRLDDAVGSTQDKAHRLRSGGSRFCPMCLAESGRWQRSWRCTWSVACGKHQVLLCDSCPSCGAHQRVKIPGGYAVIPPATCTRFVRDRSRRCGMVLSQTQAPAAIPAVLAAQSWVDDLMACQKSSGNTPEPLSDLPVLASWLLRRKQTPLQAAARELVSDSVEDDPVAHTQVRGETPCSRVALSAAVLIEVSTILGPEVEPAIALLRDISGVAAHRFRPLGLQHQQWISLSATFSNRALRAADPDLFAFDRLRMKTVLSTASLPPASGRHRLRMVPQMFWPDWSGRLLPTTGFGPQLFRAALSACLLIPGASRNDAAAHARRLNGRFTKSIITTFLAGFDQTTGALDQVLTLLCRISDYLDTSGAPIDYQRRRDLVPDYLLDWQQWRTLAFTAGAHPGPRPNAGRHRHALRYLHHLLSQSDPADPRHPFPFRDYLDSGNYIDFTVSLPPALRWSLTRHAEAILGDLGIDEPLLWSPPPELAEGLTLPGTDIDALDTSLIRRMLVEQHRTISETAAELGVHKEHVRLALERLDQPLRPPTRNAVAWARRQQAARLLTREFFDREYVAKGRPFTDIAESTGLPPQTVADFARQAGITPGKAPTPSDLDKEWLRDPYPGCRRTASDIAAALGVTPMTITRALRLMDIASGPPGVAKFPAKTAVPDKDLPSDVRDTLSGTLQGWLRLRRLQIVMALPTLEAAATYLNFSRKRLAATIRRLERDIGTPLLNRSIWGRPQSPTPAGRALLRHLTDERMQALATALVGDRLPALPTTEDIAAAEARINRPRTRRGLAPYSGIDVAPIQVRPATLTLLRYLLEHSETYGLEIAERTGLTSSNLYVRLKQLQQGGWISGRLEDEQERRAGGPPGNGSRCRRRYVALTPEGRRAALYELERRGHPAPEATMRVTQP
jgi:DNA-binding MarR family transcriptional regulator